MKKLFKALSLLLIVGLLFACNKTKVTQDQNLNTSIPIFVSSKYVKENLDNKDYIFIDARGDDKQETLKGAVTLNWKELSNVSVKPGDAGFAQMLDKDSLSKVLSDKGIVQDKNIVIFGATTGAWGEDGRVYWQLNALGYKNLQILDGGFGVIKGEKLETQPKVSTLEKADVKIDSINMDNVIDTKGLETLIKDNKDLKLIDTRTKEEFDGAKNFGEAKGGKIENSININFQTFLDDNGFLKSDEDINKIMEDNGISKSDVLVSYCTAGIRSAYVQVILNKLGYNIKNYDESFYRWSAVNEVK